MAKKQPAGKKAKPRKSAGTKAGKTVSSKTVTKKAASRKAASKKAASAKPTAKKAASRATAAAKKGARKTASSAQAGPSRKASPAGKSPKTATKRRVAGSAATRSSTDSSSSVSSRPERRARKEPKGAPPRSLDRATSGATPADGDHAGTVTQSGTKRQKSRIPRAELSRIREMLSQKRRDITEHIQSELTELENPEKKHRADLEEIASDTHESDSLCEIMGIESTQIDQIERALQQIDNGTYGICEDCGGEIPLVRLQALPFATQCIACKRRAEVRGEFSAARPMLYD